MKKTILLLSLLGVLSLTGCQSTARAFGGDITFDLEPNQKLELITWKDDALWYLTRPMRADEEAETHVYQQSTTWHVLEGSVTIIEHKE